MNLQDLTAALSDSSAASPWLHACGVTNIESGHAALVQIASKVATLDSVETLCERLTQQLPRLSDPDLALTTLARFMEAANHSSAVEALLQEDDDSLSVLLKLTSASPSFGNVLVQDPAAFDLIRVTEGEPVPRAALIRELCEEVAITSDADTVMELLRVYKRREILRIAYGDFVRGHSADLVSQQLTLLAEALCEASLQFAYRETVEQRGTPSYGQGATAKVVMIGLRRLGGQELDYESELDVLFIYDRPGRTNGERPIENQEFFTKVARRTIQLLGEQTELGTAYRLRTDRATGFHNDQLCGEMNAAIRHFDSRGRTWERLALIKARPIAGEIQVGLELLDAIEPWIYRRYLSRSDISGIRALKRRLVKRSDRQGLLMLDVEGGVLDVEFTVQFLQLINGGDDRQIRRGNTLQAIGLLEQNGAITSEEAQTLESNYQWLRRIEHRLEVMGDTHTHTLPESSDELLRLARRCGHDADSVGLSFQADYEKRITENQRVISHLLEDAFDEEVLQVDAETDLVMDPDPRPETIRNILSPYGFRDATDAYHQLSALGRERIPFLSTRRCRYFLSLISQPLLRAIARTPAPDATLANLVRVSDSLGGKGVLWELFHSHRPSLDLYVKLCSSSPYLTAILTRYPGMIDELMDSLMLAELPSLVDMQVMLEDLVGGGTQDLDLVLHGFKNTQHLNVGVRELIGQADIRDSTRVLSDVAEACLQRIAHHEYQALLRKLGEPRAGEATCGFVILGMGKLGGREPNYHSDVDFVMVYEADGQTFHPPTIRHRKTTSNQHFFGELAKRVVQAVSENRAHGRLYESDPHRRPIGKAGPAAVSLERFRSFYLEEPQRFTELREFCRARPVFGPEPLRAKATDVLREVLTDAVVTELDSESIRQARDELERTAGPRNLKRGPGGMMDVEFLTQALQLRHAKSVPQILRTNTVDCLTALGEHFLIPQEDCEQIAESYLFLRRVEAMLRLLNTTARHDLPRESDELAKLSYLLGFERTGDLERECAKRAELNRRLFEKLLE